jgi:hypothetical protein
MKKYCKYTNILEDKEFLNMLINHPNRSELIINAIWFSNYTAILISSEDLRLTKEPHLGKPNWNLCGKRVDR